MCDVFVGIWKFVVSENFDEYMKEVGKDMRCGMIGFIIFFLGKRVLWLFFILGILFRYDMLFFI